MLQIMARIEALYLEEPCSGSRRIVDCLVREGIPISRDRARNLMRRMGLCAIDQKSRTTVTGDPEFGLEALEMALNSSRRPQMFTPSKNVSTP